MVVNIVLAPVLIVGWGTGKPMGPAGAGLASTHLDRGRRGAERVLLPQARKVRGHSSRADAHPARGVGPAALIGLPVGLEFFLMSIVMAVIYWVIRDFGAAAQAGFGVGQGVMRIIMLPAMAVAFAPRRSPARTSARASPSACAKPSGGP